MKITINSPDTLESTPYFIQATGSFWLLKVVWRNFSPYLRIPAFIVHELSHAVADIILFPWITVTEIDFQFRMNSFGGLGYGLRSTFDSSSRIATILSSIAPLITWVVFLVYSLATHNYLLFIYLAVSWQDSLSDQDYETAEKAFMRLIGREKESLQDSRALKGE
jgi:hypothetical protein